MDDFKELLHIRFAERAMGWSEIEMARDAGGLKFYGTIQTNRGPKRMEVPDYSNDLDAMWAAEQYLERIGLAEPYLEALAHKTGAQDLTNAQDLFRLVSASPAERCEAALALFEASSRK